MNRLRPYLVCGTLIALISFAFCCDSLFSIMTLPSNRDSIGEENNEKQNSLKGNQSETKYNQIASDPFSSQNELFSSESHPKNDTEKHNQTSMGTEILSEENLDDESFDIIVPNPDLPINGIPLPETPPKDSTEENDNNYHDGTIILSYCTLNQVIIVNSSEEKENILYYVDNLEKSLYNAENTPPGSGFVQITIEVHRNSTIEKYVFTEMTKDNYALAKKLHIDTFEWYIADDEAFPYFLSLFNK